MRAALHLRLYSILFLYLSTFAAAWPWPRWLPELDSLVVRQDNGDNSSSAGPTNTRSNSAAKQTNTNSDDDKNTASQTNSQSRSATGSNTGSTTGTAKQTGSSTRKSSSVTRHTSFDPRLPAGGVAMITPAVISGEQFFKIGDFVTFAWNYTSLEATPTAVNVMATCTANQQLYTIAANQTVGNSTGAVTWDTGSYQATAVQDPLLTETYTLVIYDADSSISAQAQAGYLAVFDSYTFGMYTPQPYVPLSEFKCATCSGALSDMERRALGMVLGMSALTVLSFTWFVGGLGVIW